MKSLALLPLALLAFSPTDDSPADDSPAYAPAEGLTLTRRFESIATYDLVGVSITVDGESPHSDFEPDLHIVDRELIAVTDVIGSAEGGRPLELTRTFDEVLNEQTISAEAQDEDIEITQTADIEGETVVFTWDAEAEEYVATAEDEGAVDDERLELLREDMDLRGFLPDGEVAEGDTWEVEAEALLPLMWPGGFLGMYEEEEDGPDPNTQSMNDAVVEALEGGGEVTFAGTREIELDDETTVRVAVLEVEMELQTYGEIEIELDGGTPTNSVRMSRTVQGELQWDLERGVLHALTLDADAQLTFGNAFTAEGPEGEVDVEQSQDFEGTVTYRVEVTVE